MTAVWVWLLGAASYLVLAGQLSGDELAAAALLGGAAALWHRAVLRAGAARFAGDRRMVGALGRAVAGLPGATVSVGRALAGAALGRPVAGQRISRAFPHGPRDAPAEAGRRAAALLATSLSPDSYVLRLPPGEDKILFHSITSRSPGGDPRWPA